MDRIRVMIADDSDFVRDGMKIILDVDDDFEVLGTAANGRELIELAEKNRPDVILMDIQMPEMDGIEATKYVAEHDLGKVLILTTFDDDELVQKALGNGAKGYLIKNHTGASEADDQVCIWRHRCHGRKYPSVPGGKIGGALSRKQRGDRL